MTGAPIDLDAVTTLVERVARDVVTPRFRALVAGDVSVKGVDDIVTVVDTEAEAALVAGLTAIAPGVPVVGEEGTSADAGRLDVLAGAPLAWVVDPLDGTRAFVEGSPDHAVMVGLVADGEVVAGWICLPAHGRTYVAERGSGAFCNGERLPRLGARAGTALAGALAAGPALRGGVATGWMPPQVRDGLLARPLPADLAGLTLGARIWAGHAYAQVASGATDVLVYWRTWPWDHAPGAVLVREVGGVVRRPDGAEYRPSDGASGLVVAPDEATFVRVRDGLDLPGR